MIENIIEPNKLLLSWQAINNASRSRYVVAEITNEDNSVRLDYLLDSEDYKAALELGFPGHPAFLLKNSTNFDSQVVEAFSRRLPPRNRGDFAKYLELQGISPDAQLSNFALLGYTGAKLPDDGFELVHPFNEVDLQFEVIIEVAGFRHQASDTSADEIEMGTRVNFLLEPGNKHDTNAIAIMLDELRIGYVDRARTKLFQQYWQKGFDITGEVCRKNGTSERPLIYIFTTFTPPEK